MHHQGIRSPAGTPLAHTAIYRPHGTGKRTEEALAVRSAPARVARGSWRNMLCQQCVTHTCQHSYAPPRWSARVSMGQHSYAPPRWSARVQTRGNVCVPH